MTANRLGATFAAIILTTAPVAAGCAGEAAPERQQSMAAEDAASFRILPDPEFGADGVSPVRPVGVTVTGGRLNSVTLTGDDGRRVAGKLSGDKRRWTATEPLAFAMSYTWKGSASDTAGERYPISGTFRTVQPEQLVTATANVADGGVYPDDLQIAVTFSAPVDERRAVERALNVVTSPSTRGGWTWSSDTVVSWEPRGRWRPGTKIQLSGKLFGVPFGGGNYGARDMHFGFRIHAG